MNEENFIDSLRGLEGIKIGLFLLDNQYVEGTLLFVHEDHLTLKVLDNTIYFPINQIKAVSKSAKDSKVLKKVLVDDVPLNEEQLEEILNSMRMNWITINSLNNQSFTGVLYQISDDCVMLLNGEQQYFIRKEHIANIFKGFIDEKQHDNADENNNHNEESTNAAQIEDSSNLEPPQNSMQTSNNTPSEKNKKMDRRKSKPFHFKEVKFNTPIQDCTWNSNKKLNNWEESDEENTAEASTHKKLFNVDLREINEELKQGNTENSPDQKPKKQEEETKMIMEDNRKLIEKQYYALMKFAESMNSLEKQYYSLMKHAEKMYLQFRRYRKV